MHPEQKKSALFRRLFSYRLFLISEAHIESDTDHECSFLVCFRGHQVNASEVMVDCDAVVNVLGI